MSFFTILSYLNKLSLLFFIIIAGFLAYQFYLLKKENKEKNEEPFLPDFNENEKVNLSNYTKLPTYLFEEKKVIKKELRNNSSLFFGILVLTLFFFVLVLGQFNQTNKKKVSFELPSPTKKLISQSNENISLTLTLTPTVNFTPTPTISPFLSPSPTEVILLTSPTVIDDQEEKIIITTEEPTKKIVELPISAGEVEKTVFFILFSLGLIIFSLAI